MATPFEERLLELTKRGAQPTALDRSINAISGFDGSGLLELARQRGSLVTENPSDIEVARVLTDDNFLKTLAELQKTQSKSRTKFDNTRDMIVSAIKGANLDGLSMAIGDIADTIVAMPKSVSDAALAIDPGFINKVSNTSNSLSRVFQTAGDRIVFNDIYTGAIGNEGRRAGGTVADIPLGNEGRRADPRYGFDMAGVLEQARKDGTIVEENPGNTIKITIDPAQQAKIDAILASGQSSRSIHDAARGKIDTTELEALLTALTTAGSTAPLPVAPNPVGTGKSTLFTNVEDAAQGAEAAGQKVVRLGATKPGQATAIDKQVKETPNISTTSDYSTLNALQQRLATATGDEKIDLAFQLKMMAQSQAMDDYGKFVKQAETRFGIPDIEANIRTLTEMENVDPNRPPGVMSDQRKAALNMLGAARIQSRAYTEELMRGNTGVQKAILQAESVLSSFKLDDDKIRLSEARAEQAYRTAQKMDFLANPKLLNRINAMQTGNFVVSQEMRDATATKLAVKSDPKLLELANLDKNSIYELMLDPKYKDVDKSKLKNMLIADEVSVTGNVEKAKARMQLIDTVISDSLKLDVEKLADLGVPIPKGAEADVTDVMNKYKKGVKEATSSAANIGKSDAEKNAAIGTLSAIAKRKILEILTLNDFKENVNTWQGLIQSDPTASALLAKVDKSKPYNMNAFIADYLNTKDGKTLPQKAEALRQIVSSGVGANNKGSLLPELNPDSIIMSIDRLAAASVAYSVMDRVKLDSSYSIYNLFNKQ